MSDKYSPRNLTSSVDDIKIDGKIGATRNGREEMSGNLRETLTSRVMRVIHEKQILPGQRLPTEAEFCSILGISRPVVREALSVLEMLGAVVTRQGSGRVLMPLNFSSLIGSLGGIFALSDSRILDLLAVRQALEVSILPIAMHKIGPQTMLALEDTVTRMEERAAAGEHFYEEDRRFHALLYQDHGNEALSGLLDLFWQMFCAIDPEVLPHHERLEETAGHHRRIFDAIACGDMRKAQYHMETHFYDIAFALSQDRGPASSRH
ncbi:FadR/GntR family transcriptional regulator [Bosea sp. (in: a-proteobacteria)]|uniref:FadR/GntR family transcriptional regulator n=1 Tax=Bosea sp. (in: a-proteobacteria) TaxID=1871050 RepID=UPI002635F002|nr:FCD domain-containing protein [Bosea sp. (in: a-proteobacteria)]MCO5090372.1 FCD domain-containing protein [Bosea sp. (in: a-proteobacteria)]